MTVVILHTAIPPEAPPDEQDTLHQAAAIADAVRTLGYSVRCLAFDVLTPTVLQLNPPEVVVNLVEARQGHPALAYLGASVCAALHLPYTGSSAAVLMLTGQKIWTKRLLRQAGLSTPDWHEQPPSVLDAQYVLKSVTEDASLGLDTASVTADAGQLAVLWQARQQQYGGQWFAERYIDGREFNLSLLDTAAGVQVLPVAELCFWDYPELQPKILDYAAKWEAESFTALHTERCFPPEEPELFTQLRSLAVQAWRLLGLQGYARVDFRVDTQGQPWILEVNANPCLDPDIGFAQAALQAGQHYPELIAQLLRQAAPNLAPALHQPSDAAIPMSWRTVVQPADVAAIYTLVQATGVFTAEECLLAQELVQTRLQQGPASGYEFVLLEQGSRLLAYTCFGPVPATEGCYDLYWLAVAPAFQGRGLAQQVLKQTLAIIQAQGGRRVYAETSATPRYAPARRCYQQAGFVLRAVLPDFYRLDDGKLFYEYCWAGQTGDS